MTWDILKTGSEFLWTKSIDLILILEEWTIDPSFGYNHIYYDHGYLLGFNKYKGCKQQWESRRCANLGRTWKNYIQGGVCFQALRTFCCTNSILQLKTSWNKHTYLVPLIPPLMCAPFFKKDCRYTVSKKKKNGNIPRHNCSFFFSPLLLIRKSIMLGR